MGGPLLSLIGRLLHRFGAGGGRVDHNQNYRAPVGQVFNAERIEIHSELGIPLGFGRGISLKTELVLTFIDRYPQFEELAERLDVQPDRARRGALLVVLPGCNRDLHGGFVLRCACKEFLEHYTDDTSWTYLKRLRWPQGARDVGAVLRTVGEPMGLPLTADPGEIESRIFSSPNHLCFSHLVDGEDWEIDRGSLITKWVEYFAGENLRGRAQRLIIAFLCVQLATERTSACRALETFLDGLRARHADPAQAVLVTSPLRQIRQKDLEEWLGVAARYLEDELFEARLLEMPSQLFKDERSLYLRDVHAAVRGALARSLADRDRPVFSPESSR
jgi:hypothetical protein